MRIVLAAGGTGGHIFPAKAVSDELLYDGHTVLFVTDERGRKYMEQFPSSRMLNLKYKSGKIGRVLLLLQLARETVKMIKFLYQLKPTKVMGFGGYPSIPTVLAAQVLRIPTFIHEQNVRLGKANRWLSIWAKRVIGSFPKTPKSLFLGNPVRKDFLKVAPYSLGRKFNILVLGGSLGARIFNDTIPKALKKLPSSKQRKIHVTQQCIDSAMNITEKAYLDFQGTFTLSPFFDNIATEMQEASIVIARAGGSTVAELCATGRPSILVPFAASKEKDQFYNSSFMKNQGAAFMFSEYHFNADNLFKILYYLMDHPDHLIEMARYAKSISRPKAAKDIANLLTKE